MKVQYDLTVDGTEEQIRQLIDLVSADETWFTPTYNSALFLGLEDEDRQKVLKFVEEQNK